MSWSQKRQSWSLCTLQSRDRAVEVSALELGDREDLDDLYLLGVDWGRERGSGS